MDLLCLENAKTPKGESLGYLTGVLYLAPAEEAKITVNGVLISMCINASKGCKISCLYTAGRASFDPAIIKARIRRTRELFADRAAFLNRLRKDINALIRKAARETWVTPTGEILPLKPAIRLNGTSDLYWLAKILAREFPNVQFYDYTKLEKPWLRELANYHLTFSLSEDNWDHAQQCLARGFNVAVPFDVRKGQPLPAMWRGFRVVDGDRHDLRFLDGHQSAVIGLRAKGEAKHDTLGFVQIAGLAPRMA